MSSDPGGYLSSVSAASHTTSRGPYQQQQQLAGAAVAADYKAWAVWWEGVPGVCVCSFLHSECIMESQFPQTYNGMFDQVKLRIHLAFSNNQQAAKPTTNQQQPRSSPFICIFLLTHLGGVELVRPKSGLNTALLPTFGQALVYTYTSFSGRGGQSYHCLSTLQRVSHCPFRQLTPMKKHSSQWE